MVSAQSGVQVHLFRNIRLGAKLELQYFNPFSQTKRCWMTFCSRRLGAKTLAQREIRLSTELAEFLWVSRGYRSLSQPHSGQIARLLQDQKTTHAVTPRDNLETSINLRSMSLDCGRKREKTSREREKFENQAVCTFFRELQYLILLASHLEQNMGSGFIFTEVEKLNLVDYLLP